MTGAADGFVRRNWATIRLTLLLALGVLLALRLDPIAITWMRGVGFDALKDRYRLEDWWQMFRQFGYLPTWAFITTAIFLHATRLKDDGLRRAACVAALTPLIAAALSGGLADALKPIFCRTRPEHAVAPAVYAFRGFWENFPKGSGLGLPSSHTAVAFGGAFALAGLFPRAAWVFLIAAGGTAASRVMVGAHYPSDVLAGAVVAYACAGAVRALLGPKPDRP